MWVRGRLEDCLREDNLLSQHPVLARPGSELLAESTLLWDMALLEAAYALGVLVCYMDGFFAGETFVEAQ